MHAAVVLAARKEHTPLITIDEAVVFGKITLTASALRLLLERNIEITFLGPYGQFKGRLSPPFSRNAILPMARYRAHQDMARRCELARRFVIGKLANQRLRLQCFNRTHRDAEVNQAAGQLSGIIQNLESLAWREPLRTRPVVGGDNRIEGTPLETILGLEGTGRPSPSAVSANCSVTRSNGLSPVGSNAHPPTLSTPC